MTIADDTILLPGIIADGVCQEAAVIADSDVPLGYSDRLAERADAIYAANRTFAKRLLGKGDGPRDFLYMFMRHWLAAFLKAEHPALYAKLPVGFSIGEAPAPGLLREAWEAGRAA